MEEQNSNTGRNIIIAIIVIAVIAVLGYFIYNSTLKDDVDAIEDDVEEGMDDMMDNNDKFDEVGVFSGTETYGDEKANARIELILNEDKTASLALNYKTAETYTGTYTKTDKTITFTADGIDNNTTDNTANNRTDDGMTDNRTDNNTATGSEENDVNDNTTASKKTFTFTIENNMLYYNSDETNEKVKLNKTTRDTLQYINE